MATKQTLSEPFQILNNFVLNTNNLRKSPRPESQGNEELSLTLTLALISLELEVSCRSTQLKKHCTLQKKTVPCLAFGILTKFNLVPRAHVPFGQHQDTGLWNNQQARSQSLRVVCF